jgi:hypothetical protein
MINGGYDPYIQAAIDGEVAALGAARPGERNQTLFRSTAALASLGLQEGEILRLLKPAADSIGLRGKELYSTIKSGVKAGHARPREIPKGNGHGGHSVVPPSKAVFIPSADGDLRRFGDEVRRHVYQRAGKPVRIKIKRAAGQYSNWYRVVIDEADGWQAAKPDGFVAVPYVGAIDPFDPELANDLLYWPEGEKDCDTLGNAQLPAFTFGGAGDGLPDGVVDHLRGRNIVVLADNDEAGRVHAQRKAVIAHPVASSVRIVEFSELPPTGDVTDYLRTATAEDLEQRARNTALWTESPAPTCAVKSNWRSGMISARDLAEQTFKPVRYVLPGYIPEGVTLFVGKPKIGKSWLLLDVCVASAAGRFALGSIKAAQGDVLYLALEDSKRRLKDRLEKICPEGAVPSRLAFVTEWRRAGSGGVEDIAEWCDSVANPLLVVVDTLERIRPSTKPGSWQYSNDYAAISALQTLAHDRRLAIVIVHHVRKMEADDPFDMVSGTNGLAGAADTILVLKRQAGNTTLHARGRDIDEKATACEFNKSSCRWTLLGEAGEVHSSGERSAVMAAVNQAGPDGLSVLEIMAATGRRDRNPLDQLLFKMHRDGELVRVKRGIYADPGKIGKKERSESHVPDKEGKIINLTDLTNLTGDAIANSEPPLSE